MDRRSIVHIDADGNKSSVVSVSNIIGMDVPEKDESNRIGTWSNST
jgi:hypothetical protein